MPRARVHQAQSACSRWGLLPGASVRNGQRRRLRSLDRPIRSILARPGTFTWRIVPSILSHPHLAGIAGRHAAHRAHYPMVCVGPYAKAALAGGADSSGAGTIVHMANKADGRLSPFPTVIICGTWGIANCLQYSGRTLMIETEFAELMSTPNALLKTRILETRSEPPYQEHYAPSSPWLHNSIIEEMYNWRHKFIGRSALEFKHCLLIIKIRRNQELQRHLDSFFLLWVEEAYFLTMALNTKWLVSACDTFADHCNDDAERATAIVAATMIKTIKIYETEMLFRFKRLEPTQRPDYRSTHLFDGLHSFNIGYGDVVLGLKNRIKNLVRRGTPTSLILDELFERVCMFDTAFSRWRAEHTHEPTRW